MRKGWACLFFGLIAGSLIACSSPPPLRLPTENTASRLTPEQAKDVTVYAIGLVGTPYRWGGNTPESGFDCSGLIAHVYQKSASLKTPRTVAELQEWGAPISTNAIRSGDLIVFSKGKESTHAGIYVGDGRFVHAPSTGGRVRLDRFTSSYWSNYKIAFNRP
jgi:cell wall-associated NlpC family hydrolase